MMSDTDNTEEYKRIKKCIGMDSDDRSDKQSYTFTKLIGNIGIKSYDRMIMMCKKIKINVYTNKNKIKNYEQLIEACNKKKREVIKQCIMTMAPYGGKKGFEKLAGTYIIESLCDEMTQKLRAIDTVIEIVQKEANNDNNNILSLMGIHKQTKSIKSDDTPEIILEEYSDGR